MRVVGCGGGSYFGLSFCANDQIDSIKGRRVLPISACLPSCLYHLSHLHPGEDHPVQTVDYPRRGRISKLLFWDHLQHTIYVERLSYGR